MKQPLNQQIKELTLELKELKARNLAAINSIKEGFRGSDAGKIYHYSTGKNYDYGWNDTREEVRRNDSGVEYYYVWRKVDDFGNGIKSTRLFPKSLDMSEMYATKEAWVKYIEDERYTGSLKEFKELKLPIETLLDLNELSYQILNCPKLGIRQNWVIVYPYREGYE